MTKKMRDYYSYEYKVRIHRIVLFIEPIGITFLAL